MAYRGSDAERPLIGRYGSADSLGGLGSRMSSVSDFSDLASPPEQYDSQTQRNRSEDYVSPQTSIVDLHSPIMTESPLEDIDVSHVRLSYASQNDRFSVAAARLPASLRTGTSDLISPKLPASLRTGTLDSTSPKIPASLRTGTPDSPASNKRFSWGPQNDIASPTDKPSSSSITGRRRSTRSNSGWRRSRHTSIPEEDGMDAGLVNNAQGFGRRGTSYEIQEDHEMDEIESFGVDISSFTGPMNPRDQAMAKEYQKLESTGHLTGGLGVGFTPEVTINSKDLLSPMTPTDVGRRLSRRSTVLGRTPTIRDLAQREANRRGKIVEVVVDEVPEEIPSADIGYFGGDVVPVEFDPLANRQTTNAPKKLTYYPQPDWKPVSMRWPYLASLVIVSISLAVGQEFLLQRSLKKKEEGSGLFQFTSPKSMPTWDYFVYKYLPTMIAVTYGVLWQVADYEIKRLEPYYQLSKEGGSLAAESINVDYITIFNFFRPIMALRYRHYAVAVSSVATLFSVSLVPTLQGPSIMLEPDRQARLLHPDGLKFINVNVIWSRFLTTVLSIIAVLGAILLYQLSSRRSGLVGDVKGIAGIAAMATKSHVLMDFKDLDTVPPQDIHDKLRNHRYTLRNSSLAPEDAPLTNEDKYKYDQYHLSPNPHPFMMRLVAGIPLIISLVLFLGIIPLLLFTPANVVLDKVPWLLTALAVAIKISFQTLEQDVRMMEPFFRLSCRHAPPKVLTLDYTGMAFGYMPIRAFMNGDHLVALVGTGSVLAEILTICVTSFAGVTGADFLPPPPKQPGNTNGGQTPQTPDSTNSGEETLVSFWVSFALSMAIVTYLVVVAVAVYKLRRHPFMPRQPSTIASVLAFIHQSKMLYDFVAASDSVPSQPSSSSHPNLTSNDTSGAGSPLNDSRGGSSSSTTAMKDAKQRRISTAMFGNSGGSNGVSEDGAILVRRLEQMGKTYGLGWFTGRDGETHCGVDQEELRGGYKHSAMEDARKASKPWLGNWEYL